CHPFVQDGERVRIGVDRNAERLRHAVGGDVTVGRPGDGDIFGHAKDFLRDPVLRRRLVRTQIEETWTLGRSGEPFARYLNTCATRIATLRRSTTLCSRSWVTTRKTKTRLRENHRSLTGRGFHFRL